MDSRWLAPVIFGQIGWEDLFLSLRFSAWRHPDIYNDYLIGFLKHAEPQALQAIAAYEQNRSSDERIVVDAPGGRYEMLATARMQARIWPSKRGRGWGDPLPRPQPRVRSRYWRLPERPL